MLNKIQFNDMKLTIQEGLYQMVIEADKLSKYPLYSLNQIKSNFTVTASVQSYYFVINNFEERLNGYLQEQYEVYMRYYGSKAWINFQYMALICLTSTLIIVVVYLFLTPMVKKIQDMSYIPL